MADPLNLAQRAQLEAKAAAATEASKKGDASGKGGLGHLEKKGRTPMPVQRSDESVGAYARRLREWREGDTAAIEAAATKIPRK